jgi:signal transduction histidine kinase
MSQNRNAATLSDALYELSLAQGIPDAPLLDEFVRRYPEYADDLTDFAIMLAVDSLREASQSDLRRTDLAEDELSPTVSRAMSRFYNRLHAVQRSENISGQKGVSANEISPNPFATLDRAAFRALAEKLNVNSAFIIKLRDRQIAPETIPKRFTDHLAQELKVPPDILMGHLNALGQPQIQAQYYKAADKPQWEVKQTFSDAVKTSGLSDEQQRYLLGM